MENLSQSGPPAVDLVNHPPHYTSLPAQCDCGRGIECIDVTENMGFNIGNAVKYLWREGFKGKSIEDLRKARWYIDREIAKRMKGETVAKSPLGKFVGVSNPDY